MPASDLFVSSYDAEFRLRNTWIVVGKMALHVLGVLPHSDPKKIILDCVALNGSHVGARLGDLPLSAMINCPSGYYFGRWYGRAPARHRFQGLKTWSWWGVNPDGTIFQNDENSPETLLSAFLSQPRVRAPGSRIKGVLTRDVCLDAADNIRIRGRVRGKYIGGGKALIDPRTPEYARTLLDYARLNWEERQAITEEEPTTLNPCAELELA